MSPLVMSFVYSLPVKERIWPDSAASPILSIASMNWSTDAVSGSCPSEAATTPTVSRISLSIVTLPLLAGSNSVSTLVGSPLTRSLR